MNIASPKTSANFATQRTATISFHSTTHLLRPRPGGYQHDFDRDLDHDLDFDPDPDLDLDFDHDPDLDPDSDCDLDHNSSVMETIQEAINVAT